MFTGIVEGMGRVERIEDLDTSRRFTIDAGQVGAAASPGDSLAVDGACLTVTTHEGPLVSVNVIGTTIARTIAGRYEPGSLVNLERPLALGGRLDGHMVQGHVDGVGTLRAVRAEGEYWLMDFELPDEAAAVTVLHGSIAVNGVSLTVSDQPEELVCRIGVIPYTWEHTNLGRLAPGDPVNVEADLIGKYVGKILARRNA